MVAKFTLPALPHICSLTGAEDHFILGDMTDFLALAKNSGFYPRDAWKGGLDANGVNHAIEHGHLPSAAQSEKFLAEVESLIPQAPTSRHEIIDDVVGAFPNVPAFIAGQPLSMRRKVKRPNEFQPIAVVVDLTSSAVISAETVAKRGAAILALVRALSARRPVELWIGCGLDANSQRNALWQFYKMDTAPLDLARTAFMLAHPGACRGAMHQIAYGREYRFEGNWPYGTGPVREDKFRAILARAMPHVTDVIACPSIYATDQSVSNPVAWIAAHLATHAGEFEAEAA